MHGCIKLCYLKCLETSPVALKCAFRSTSYAIGYIRLSDVRPSEVQTHWFTAVVIYNSSNLTTVISGDLLQNLNRSKWRWIFHRRVIHSSTAATLKRCWNCFPFLWVRQVGYLAFKVLPALFVKLADSWLTLLKSLLALPMTPGSA